ncbi:ABC transporter ATP-binding protein [Pseudanabaena sp. Chao 1811]|uniref:ABC transporter ATP-binding protein n=1 Tax=Pseudanabaena sp. Chao 1811 TaxID=2963092 RepID=UPI0022F3B201|nr:ABC transporter ATP-binding protein [Pseudanabaena sp. Chao 1811]
MFIRVKNLSKIYHIQVSEVQPSSQGKRANTMSKGRNDKVVIDDISFEIFNGERVGIIGSNGAGKSTLLQIIADIAKPTSGIVEKKGKVTAVMTLGVGLREELTGRDNIYIDGEVQGKSRLEIDEVIDKIIAFADLSDFIDYPVRTYSTGMKSRLAFSMLVCIEPEILIIDEALSAGDANFSIKASKKIREICDLGRIVILVSHSMPTIVEMCDRCIWMEHGKIVMDGDPQTVTDAYLDAVHHDDEIALLEQNIRLIKDTSFRKGCQINQISISYSDNQQSQTILVAGRDITITLHIRVDTLLECPDVRLKITRLDGKIFVNTLLSDQSTITSNDFHGILAFVINMTPLVLGQGKYVVACELLDRGEIVAAKSTILQVLPPPNAPTGGRPALFYPCSVETYEICSETN